MCERTRTHGWVSGTSTGGLLARWPRGTSCEGLPRCRACTLRCGRAPRPPRRTTRSLPYTDVESESDTVTRVESQSERAECESERES